MKLFQCVEKEDTAQKIIARSVSNHAYLLDDRKSKLNRLMKNLDGICAILTSEWRSVARTDRRWKIWFGAQQPQFSLQQTPSLSQKMKELDLHVRATDTNTDQFLALGEIETTGKCVENVEMFHIISIQFSTDVDWTASCLVFGHF